MNGMYCDAVQLFLFLENFRRRNNMRDKKYGVAGYEAYQKNIDLELFHGLFHMIMNLTEKKVDKKQLNDVEQSIIWWNPHKNYGRFFEESGLRYPGEVLERYEASFGAKKENLRALALALGYASPFLESSMFVGRQKEVFISKILKESEEDVYLHGALYLLEGKAEKQKELLAALTRNEYQYTEEAVFVLSLYSDPREGFEKMQDQIMRQFSINRTFSLLKNAGVVEWMISRYQSEIKKCRRRDAAVIKALMKLPYMFVKEESAVFQTLYQGGYSRIEIAFANSYMVWSQRIYDAVCPDGIVAEKIAAECCVVCLNHDKELEKEFYDYLAMLFMIYKSFNIKYQENQGIWNAVRERIDPVNPQTVLWMIQNLEDAQDFTYHFDVMEKQWDLLSEKLDSRTYCELFASQMLQCSDVTGNELLKMMNRYQELTGRVFQLEFHESWKGVQQCFELLVEKRIICLWDYYKQLNDVSEKSKERSKEFELIYTCIRGARNREAFDFIRQLISASGFDAVYFITGNRREFSEAFVRNLERYQSGNVYIDIRRDFLSADEKRQLFSWVDEAVFREKPELYYTFVREALKNEIVREIFMKEDLKEVFLTLIHNSLLRSWDEEVLKQYFYTTEEILADKEAKEAKKVEEEIRKAQRELEGISNKLTEIYDGSFSSLKKFINTYYMDRDKKKAIPFLWRKLEKMDGDLNLQCSNEEFCDFLYLCTEIVRLGEIPRKQIAEIMEKVIRRQYNVTNE